MKSFFDLDEFSLADVESLIENKAEESYYLEFKEARALDNTDEVKTEISRDISAFANADGGILIYGLSEKDNKANKITWIDKRKFSKEWLQQVIDARITRRINEIRIFPISNQENGQEQIFVLKISPSNQAPHMASDNGYYERDNKGKRKMLEHQVREGYFKKGKTDLIIEEVRGRSGIGMHSHNNRPTKVQFDLQFFIKNVGPIVEPNCKLEVVAPSAISERSSYISNHNEFYEMETGRSRIISFGTRTNIYQTETFPIGSVKITVSHATYSIFESGDIELKLYYSNGIKHFKYRLKDYLVFEGNELSWNDLAVYP